MESSKHTDTSFRCGDKMVATRYVFCVFLFFLSLLTGQEFSTKETPSWRKRLLGSAPAHACFPLPCLRHDKLGGSSGFPGHPSITRDVCRSHESSRSIPEFLNLNILH